MGRKPHGGSKGGRLERTYEGPGPLRELLAAAGSDLAVEDVEAMFESAVLEGLSPDEVLPDLFDEEPRFADPEQARRLYGNLLGLWDALASGGGRAPAGGKKASGPVKPAPAPAPEPPEAFPLDDAFVASAWRHLDDLPARERQRLQHRYENTQPDLSEYVRLEAGDGDAAVVNADALVFELWAMLELARPGERVRAVRMEELEEASGPGAGSGEPALERYVDEALAEAALDDEEPLEGEAADRVRALALTALACLVRACPWRQPLAGAPETGGSR